MASDDAQWRQLEGLSVLINLLPQTWRTVRGMWPLLLAMALGGGGGQQWVDLLLVSLFFSGTVGATVLHWATLRYRLYEGRLEIQTGLLNRQVRVIAPERVQNTELVRNVLHRLTGLVEVRIETASGAEVEGLLSALSEAEALRLVGALDAARGHHVDPGTEEADLPALVEHDLWQLARYGVTATRLGAAVVVFGLLLEGLQSLEPTGMAERSESLGWLGGIALVLVVVTGTWLVGSVTAVVRHYGYRMVLRGPTLVAEEGLFTRRRVELPVAKVQLLTFAEPVLRRIAGFGSVHIETAAARPEGSGTERSEAMIPVVAHDRLSSLIRVALEGFDLDLDQATLLPPHPRAVVREFTRAVFTSAALAAALSWWFWPHGLLAVVLVPLSLVEAWLDVRHQGWVITDRVVVARQGYLNRRTQIVSRDKLQSLEAHQGPLLRRYGLGTLTLRVAGSEVTLPVLSWDRAQALAVELAGARSVTKRDGVDRGTKSAEGPSPAEQTPVDPV